MNHPEFYQGGVFFSDQFIFTVAYVLYIFGTQTR